MPTHQTEDLVPKILETLGRANPSPITVKPLNAKQSKWFTKWIQLKHRPGLEELEFCVYEFCRDYSKKPSSGRRLIICGPNGVGKTHAAKAIYRWADAVALNVPLTPTPTEDGVDLCVTRPLYLFWPAVVDGFKNGEWDIIQKAETAPLLILDDIGAEHDPSGIAKEKLFFLLERREVRWTVVTTNVVPEQWETKFEKRIASRLLRNTQLVSLDTLSDYCA